MFFKKILIAFKVLIIRNCDFYDSTKYYFLVYSTRFLTYMALIEQIKTGSKAECPVKRLNYNLDIQGLGYYQQMLLKKFDLLYMSTEEFKNRLLLAKILNIRQDLLYLF